MPGLLYPAYQKFYSAICSLKRFSAEKNFFDNISSLDTFFSEYRSTTLVMQKSLAHTPHIKTYENLSAGIWDPFFNSQRVKTIHVHPVEFSKKIDITVYFPSASLNIISQSFTVENDIPLNSLIDSIKDFLKQINPIEVLFSARFSFIEKDNDIELWDKLISGIVTMQKFMDTMYTKIGEKCALCEKLRKEIDKAGFSLLPKDFFLVSDYAYYPQKNEFERAGRIAMIIPGTQSKSTSRHSIKKFMKLPYLNYNDSPFEKFVLMNAVIGSTDLMPTIMKIYQDDTYDLDTFHADIKTTFYRKINETAEEVLNGGVKEVYLMNTYVCVPYDDALQNLTSKERLAKGSVECLSFMKVDCDLNESEYVFEGEHIKQMEYIAHQVQHGKKEELDLGAINMLPIINAFKLLKTKEQPTD